MVLRNSIDRWGSVAKVIHWLIALLVVTQMVLAGIAAELPAGDQKLVTLGRHMSVGVVILGLMVVRLAWRLLNVVPETPVKLKPALRRLASATHAALYVLLLALPISGWMMSSANGVAVSLFGWFSLPAIVNADTGLSETVRAVHRALSWALGMLVLLHAAGALAHHFVLRDDVLRRMLPCTRASS